MKQIKVNAYEFNELNQKAKNEVIYWLDQDPLDCETEDEQGNTIKELEYYHLLLVNTQLNQTMENGLSVVDMILLVQQKIVQYL